jgi:hypothetical protein
VQLDEFGSLLKELAAKSASGTATVDNEHPYLFS